MHTEEVGKIHKNLVHFAKSGSKTDNRFYSSHISVVNILKNFLSLEREMLFHINTKALPK